MPEDVIVELESLYRKTIARKIEAILDDAKYNKSYVAAWGFGYTAPCHLPAYHG